MYPAAYFVTFRVRLSRQGKARSAVNGDTLYKERNAALAAQTHSECYKIDGGVHYPAD